MYEYLKSRSDLIFNGFKSAGITEAVKKANEVFQIIENPFTVSRNQLKSYCFDCNFLLRLVILCLFRLCK